MTIPYTYLIGWRHLDRWYYGVKFSNHCSPKDFWVTYKTSSDLVKKFVIEHGDPDIRIIRKTFSKAEDAVKYEDKVLRRIKAIESARWLNQNRSGIEFFRNGPCSQDHKNKISISKKGKPNKHQGQTFVSEETYKKIGRKNSQNLKGRKKGSLSELHKAKISEGVRKRNKMIPRPPSSLGKKAKISQSMKGNIPWNKGKRGISESTRLKIREKALEREAKKRQQNAATDIA